MSTIILNKALNAPLSLLRKGRLPGLLFFLFTQLSFAQPGNEKQVFDLNDPRNPDCPCHKYQKMADDEFEQLQKKNKLNQLEHTADFESYHSTSGYPKYSKKHKTLKGRQQKHVNLFSVKSPKTKRFKPCYSVCFKW